MKNKPNNFAYIDGANLHKGISGFDWSLDYARFRVWLSENIMLVTPTFLSALFQNIKTFTLISKKPVLRLSSKRLSMMATASQKAIATLI